VLNGTREIILFITTFSHFLGARIGYPLVRWLQYKIRRDSQEEARAPITGYKKMIWLIGKLDGHARISDGIPGEARIANEFHKRNPDAQIRVALFDLPITHYGHVERPKQLAGAMIVALRWLQESQR
jgi:hypothetical protein